MGDAAGDRRGPHPRGPGTTTGLVAAISWPFPYLGGCQEVCVTAQITAFCAPEPRLRTQQRSIAPNGGYARRYESGRSHACELSRDRSLRTAGRRAVIKGTLAMSVAQRTRGRLSMQPPA